MKYKLIYSCLFLALLQSCAFTPHEVALYATAPSIQSSIGEETKIALRFYDDRDSKTVGQRGAGMVGADISATNLLSHLESEIRNGLESQGFEILPQNSPDANVRLTISLRSFKFFIETGFWTGANNVSAAIKAEGRKDGDDYVNSYTFDSEERSLVVPDGSGIDTILNAALQDVMTQLLADKALMQFLTNY